MAQQQSRVRGGPAEGRSGLGQDPRRGRGCRPPRARDRHLHLFLDPAPRHAGGRGGASRHRAARPCRRVGGADPAGLCRCAGGPAAARRGVPRRHRRDVRPRSGDRPLHRAGALLQGLPRHSDASACALALEQGPQGLRLLPSEPLVRRVPVRHPSGMPGSAAASSSITPPGSWSARPRRSTTTCRSCTA